MQSAQVKPVVIFEKERARLMGEVIRYLLARRRARLAAQQQNQAKEGSKQYEHS